MSGAPGKLGRALHAIRRGYGALGSVTRVIGALTAVIAFGTAVAQVYSAISDNRARRAAETSLIKLADSQLQNREYYASWNANAKAVAIAPKNETALAQQALIAMRWLEDARLSSKPGAKSFGDIAEPLEEALARRATSARGTELADIKAHIGWARFLRSRDGVTGLRIKEEFSDALAIDPGNMYAHVMNGFFILWRGGRVEAARADIDASLESNVNPAFRDRMILAALNNFHTDEHEVAAIEYANKIRNSGRLLDAEAGEPLLWIYQRGLDDSVYLAKLAHVMPPEDHLATLDWLTRDESDRERQRIHRALRGYFREIAGEAPQALALYREVVASAPKSGNRATDFARAGIHRLSQESRDSSGQESGAQRSDPKPAR